MPRSMVYVIGYPGSGKTTALSKAITSPVANERDKPFKHIVYADGAIQLGASRAAFGGTDALPMNVQPAVLKWLPTSPEELIIAEGDRLGNTSFFQALGNLGVPLRIVLIDVTPLQARYRAWLRGHAFNEQWLAGRITKVDNLRRRWFYDIELVDGVKHADAVAEDLRTILYG